MVLKVVNLEPSVVPQWGFSCVVDVPEVRDAR